MSGRLCRDAEQPNGSKRLQTVDIFAAKCPFCDLVQSSPSP
jgi:hypothetical protein